jgi:hypothetical protein
MAQGTFTLFNEAAISLMDGRIDLDTDTLKFALISTVPVATAAVPCWGAGGTTNLSSNEVSGDGYAAGGKELTTVAWTQTGGVGTLSADPLSGADKWAQDGAGPTNIKTGILYSDSATNKDAIGFMDMTADGGTTAISLQAGDISVTWNVAGIFTHTVNP